MNFIRKLPTPQEIKEQYPLSEDLVKIKQKNDIEIQKVFQGESDKLILIIGPCSADTKILLLTTLKDFEKSKNK
jgi:3-deoxy-D-arabino-heptulosonate 7-phosphate (DAHP) synthase